MKTRKIPMRMCTGCGEMKPKKELVRIVRSPDDSVSYDPTGKKAGRGAYLCRNVDCFKKARKSKRLEKGLDCTIAEQVYDQIESEIASDG